MHCELVVPGLFSAPAPERLPALELLLARGRSRSSPARRLEEWLHEGFALGEQPLAAGALTRLAAGAGAPDAWCARADPVHLRLMRDRLILVPGAALGVSAEEAKALCEALQGHFPDYAFAPAGPARWLMSGSGEPPACADENPLELAGREVGLAMPAAVHRLVNEAQMVLHAHPANEAREARGEATVNSVWLWGGGRAPRVPACRWRSVAADEPLALGLARLAGARAGALPASAAAWLERETAEGRHLALLDALRVPLALGQDAECRERLRALEREWFAPLLAALRAGRVGMLTLQVPDAGRSAVFETVRGDLRRIWRRARALEHYA